MHVCMLRPSGGRPQRLLAEYLIVGPQGIKTLSYREIVIDLIHTVLSAKFRQAVKFKPWY